MKTLYRKTFAEINLSTLVSNYTILKRLLPNDMFFCPMVKSDGYGHGGVAVARQLRANGSAHLGVALLEEALELRMQGDTHSVLLFGPFDAQGAEQIFQHSITPVVSDWSQLESLDVELKKSRRTLPLSVHLEFNTGMNRLGFAAASVPDLIGWFQQRPLLKLEGICSHLLKGDDVADNQGYTKGQLLRFKEICAPFISQSLKFHILNSAGMVALGHLAKEDSALAQSLGWPLGGRPGISLYGVQPSANPNLQLNLSPVLSLKTHIAQIRTVQRGETISYGATFTAPSEMTVAVLPIGYGDGVPRLLSNRGMVLYRSQRCRILGVVCMDYIMIDVTHPSKEGEPQIGEEVVLIGAQGTANIAAEEMAGWAQTIGYEILTGLSQRIPRIYLR